MQTQRQSISHAALPAVDLKSLPVLTAPVVLAECELRQVSGGAPKGTWCPESAYFAPKGSW